MLSVQPDSRGLVLAIYVFIAWIIQDKDVDARHDE